MPEKDQKSFFLAQSEYSGCLRMFVTRSSILAEAGPSESLQTATG
jgi:hypothetical protein